MFTAGTAIVKKERRPETRRTAAAVANRRCVGRAAEKMVVATETASSMRTTKEAAFSLGMRTVRVAACQPKPTWML
jgi:hypothetical protein